jgi:hypothetical protein
MSRLTRNDTISQEGLRLSQKCFNKSWKESESETESIARTSFEKNVKKAELRYILDIVEYSRFLFF